jgi:sugar O-acyltransferase (sialic acid O-acetyltransferase NeuD family)
MKLLILGAGGHGKVCGEIASDYGYEIAFLDDNAPEAIGKLVSYQEKRKEYDYAFVAMGNPELREKWTQYLTQAGYKVVKLISTKAMVAPSVEIDEGSVVMAGVIIQSNCVVGRSCILSAGAIIDHDSKIGNFIHINAGAIVPSMSEVKDKTKINYGEVWKNV